MKLYKLILASAIGLFVVSGAFAQTTLVPRGSNWKYLDNGSNQGTGWTAPAFNDLAWAAGNAQLGYGDGDEATVVSYGPNSSAKFITTYFRRSFNVANPADYASLTLNILRDDGAVVYLNGTEVFRTNMPGGAIGYLTPASVAISGGEETSIYIQAALSTSLLVAGTNVLAVEIHQSGGTSSDISFDLDLIGNSGTPTPTVTRGPYLQMGAANARTGRWRTNIATDSRVQYGTVQGSLSQTVNDSNVTGEHEVRLTGLVAGTKYFYSVGTTTQTLAGNDANHFFVTSPNTGQINP